MRILFLVPYPLNESPSQRFRFEQYFATLKDHNINYIVYPFLTQSGWSVLYAEGMFLKKTWHILRGFISRMFHLFNTIPADFVFIHREATPVGPPVIEWAIAKIFKKRIIYDFDDAIWATDRDESFLMQFLRWRGKVGSICKWSYKISCGNRYLQEYALTFNSNSFINPTTIDTELHNPVYHTKLNSDTIVIGWTGTHSTLKYLNSIEKELQDLERQFNQVRFLVIANKPPNLNLTRLDFIAWSKESEIADLMRMDIGIMPLPNDEWSNGKCGFKILQYMALGIPALASNVGVNSQIIHHGIEGFLCTSTEQWSRSLAMLIEDPILRKEMGSAGRKNVVNNYSVHSNTSNFLSLFE